MSKNIILYNYVAICQIFFLMKSRLRLDELKNKMAE